VAEPEKKMSAEDDLLRRCADGDAAAYRELVGRLEKPLVNFLLRYVGERHVAEDLFQETFVRVVRGLASFRPDAALSTWIYTIARNLALDHLKARRRHRETPLDAASTESGGKVIPFSDVLRAATVPPAERAEAVEDERRVAEALGKLSPAKREALVLRVYAGLPYADVARVVGSPVGTVKFRIHEALNDLAKLLGAEGRGNAAREDLA
jgi:RNA polymerase sigma-70 factor (ECF subfamily)